MKDKIVLITGANAGIGKETARAIAKMGSTVILACRNLEKGNAALEDIRSSTGNDKIHLIQLDLASLASVREAAKAFTDQYDRLDILINNAGLIVGDRRETQDGFEMTMGVNHLGHFLFTHLLLDHLKASPAARIVNVSSDAHKGSRGLKFDDLMGLKGSYSSFTTYADSKLANILFTKELAKRLEGTSITTNCLHPGVVNTRFGSDGDMGPISTFLFALGKPFMTTAAKGARTSIFLATDPGVETTTGLYFKNSKVSKPTRYALDEAAARQLWEVSENLVGISS